jgi:hypothetical protein
VSKNLKRKVDALDGPATESSSSPAAQLSKKRKFPHLTELTELYSHPPWHNDYHDGDHQGLSYSQGPLKSGFTPLDPGPFAAEDEWEQYGILERYQRRRFQGQFNDPHPKTECQYSERSPNP